MRFTVLDSPLGGLLAVRDDVGLTGLYLPTARHVVSPHPSWRRADADFDEERGQLAEYFAGTRVDFELTLNPAGTPFQLTVWSALREIPYGATASYGKIAAAIGNLRPWVTSEWEHDGIRSSGDEVFARLRELASGVV